jgi:hypothetical protein
MLHQQPPPQSPSLGQSSLLRAIGRDVVAAAIAMMATTVATFTVIPRSLSTLSLSLCNDHRRCHRLVDNDKVVIAHGASLLRSIQSALNTLRD